MSTRENNHDDTQLEAFLRGEDELSRRLQQLPQPKPPEELSAAILAAAEAALRSPRAANDPVVPPAEQSPMPAPHFLRRARVPLGLAASVMLAALLVLRMQEGSRPDEPPLLAQASIPPVPSVANSGTPSSAAATGVVLKGGEAKSDVAVPRSSEANAGRAHPKRATPQQDGPATMIAQAEIPGARDEIVLRSAPPVSPSAAPASRAGEREPKAWLVLIEELLKADLKRDAQEEWQKFRKAYPKYPVPDGILTKMGESDKAQTTGTSRP